MCSGRVPDFRGGNRKRSATDGEQSNPRHRPGYYYYFYLPTIVQIPRAKKLELTLEWLRFILGGCMGKSTQDSDHIVALN